jgi:hypothetical protein
MERRVPATTTMRETTDSRRQYSTSLISRGLGAEEGRNERAVANRDTAKNDPYNNKRKYHGQSDSANCRNGEHLHEYGRESHIYVRFLSVAGGRVYRYAVGLHTLTPSANPH